MIGQILSKLTFITVEPVLLFYMLIVFMETNALQELFFVKSCLMLNNPENLTECSYELKANLTEASIEAANWSKYNLTFFFFWTLLSTFYVGSWSDRFGRKFPMLIPPIGTIVAATINSVLAYFIETHIAYFFISSFVSGITFGSVGIISATFGYISDFTHERSRTKRIVILESMIFIGGTLGVYVAGVFLNHVSFQSDINNFVQLFIFEAVSAAAIVIYIYFRIPQCTSDTQLLQTPLSCKGLFSIQHLLDSLKTVFRFREDGKRKKVLLMLIALFLVYFGNVVQFTLGYYFLKQQNWTFKEYTVFHAIQFAVEGAALIFVFPVLHHFPQIPDHFVGILGLISRIAGCAVFGLSNSSIMIYSCIAIYTFSEFPAPVLRSMLSKTVSSDEKGKIFAITTILLNFSFLLGSFTLMTIFTEFSFHGLCFEVAAALQVGAVFIFLYLYFTRTVYITQYETVDHEDGSTSEICNVVAATGSSNED